MCLVRLQYVFRILDVEDTEVIVPLIKVFQACCVYPVFEFCDSEVLNLDWIRDRPLKADRNGWNMVLLFEKLQMRSPRERLSAELENKWLAVCDLEVHLEVVLADFLGEVENADVALLAWLKLTAARLNDEELVVKHVLLEGLLLCGSCCAFLIESRPVG